MTHLPSLGPRLLDRALRDRRPKSRLLPVDARRRLTTETAGRSGTLPGLGYVAILADVERARTALGRTALPTGATDDSRTIEIGDHVTLRRNGVTERIVLTDPMDAMASDTHVSVRSPLGLALLGRSVGDLIVVRTPFGHSRHTVLHRSRANQ